MEREKIINVLTRELSNERLSHCIRVEAVALELAVHFNADPELVSPAALFHDLCREMAPDLLLKLAINFGIVIDDIEKDEPLLLHGSVAAVKIQHEFGIRNPQILEAISYHITGTAGMSRVAQVIFIADFIEPGRSFSDAKLIREAVQELSPDQLLLKVYNSTIYYLLRDNYRIHPRTVAGRNELLMKGAYKS